MNWANSINLSVSTTEDDDAVFGVWTFMETAGFCVSYTYFHDFLSMIAGNKSVQMYFLFAVMV